MGMGPFSIGCCNCGGPPPPPTYSITFSACAVGSVGATQHLPGGVSISIALAGTTVATGTTDGAGMISASGLLPSTAYTATATGYGSPRYIAPTAFTTPGSGSSFGITIAPNTAGGYICTGICVFPLSNRMIFVAGAGTFTLKWDTVSGVPGYYEVSTGSPNVTDNGTIFQWLFSVYFRITLNGVTTCTFSTPVATTFTDSTPTLQATMTETTPVP
jgi:hypothetical protein